MVIFIWKRQCMHGTHKCARKSFTVSYCKNLSLLSQLFLHLFQRRISRSCHSVMHLIIAGVGWLHCKIYIPHRMCPWLGSQRPKHLHFNSGYQWTVRLSFYSQCLFFRHSPSFPSPGTLIRLHNRFALAFTFYFTLAYGFYSFSLPWIFLFNLDLMIVASGRYLPAHYSIVGLSASFIWNEYKLLTVISPVTVLCSCTIVLDQSLANSNPLSISWRVLTSIFFSPSDHQNVTAFLSRFYSHSNFIRTHTDRNDVQHQHQY